MADRYQYQQSLLEQVHNGHCPINFIIQDANIGHYSNLFVIEQIDIGIFGDLRRRDLQDIGIIDEEDLITFTNVINNHNNLMLPLHDNIGTIAG